MQHGAHIGAAKLWYDKPRKHSICSSPLRWKKKIPPQKRIRYCWRGCRTTLTWQSQPIGQWRLLLSGKQVPGPKATTMHDEKAVAAQRTRSATRRLVIISGRERRLNQATNHEISRRIVTTPTQHHWPERPDHIRERTRRKQGKKAPRKQRRANRHASQWPLPNCMAILPTKRCVRGVWQLKVDANYTSQASPCVGIPVKTIARKKGLLFVCQSCHYTLHADLIGARNVALRTAAHPARLD